jgi:co-chaperonin GroES (HSP10)
MKSITPLKKNILFRFIQELSAQRGFENKTEWGFSIIDKKSDMQLGRWGEVIHVGPEVKDIKVGEFIFIEPLQWTNMLTINKKNYWMTNIDKVLLVSSEKPVTM